jgi:predicted dehydrogenase
MEVVGSERSIHIADPFKPGLSNRLLLGKDGQMEAVDVTGGELYAGEVENMADAILSGAPTRVTLADSRANVATLLGLYRSAEVGAPVIV